MLRERELYARFPSSPHKAEQGTKDHSPGTELSSDLDVAIYYPLSAMQPIAI